MGGMDHSTSDVTVHAQRAPGSRLVMIGERLAVPERFTATVEPADEALPICDLAIVVEQGRPVCSELTLRRSPGGPPLTGTVLRYLPIGDYVRRAADALGRWKIRARDPNGPLTLTVADEDGEPETHLLDAEPFDDEHVAVPIAGGTLTSDYRAATRAPRERGRVSDEMLRETANVYRAALAAGKRPTQAVTREMHVSRATAGRWVAQARKRGFLGPARPRVAGEVREDG
jgi:hypothetical protein